MKFNIKCKPKKNEIEATENLIALSFGLEDIDAQNLGLDIKNIPDVMNQLDLIEREALENVDLRKLNQKEKLATKIRDFKQQKSLQEKERLLDDQPLMKAFSKLPESQSIKTRRKKRISKIFLSMLVERHLNNLSNNQSKQVSELYQFLVT